MRIRILCSLGAAVLSASLAVDASGQGVVAVVSARSPITALDPGQVADIFLGKTWRFPDGTQAVPVDLAEDSRVREKFYEQFTGKSPAQVKAHWAKIIFTGRGQPPRQVAGSAEAKKFVAENPNAIAYIDERLVDKTVRVLASR